MAGRLQMTDTLNRILIIIWTRLAALLLLEQRDSLRLNLSLSSTDWYQSCTFLAQEEEMKGGKKGGVCSAVCMAFCTRSQNGEGIPIGVVGNHPEILIKILYCTIMNT